VDVNRKALGSPEQQTMQLCSVWVLLVALPADAVPPSSTMYDVDAAFVQHGHLSWIANNRNKFASGSSNGSTNSNVSCWTLISTRAFGEVHKVPQENVPPAKAEEVERALLRAMEQAANLPQDHLFSKKLYTKSQLWGAGIPLNCTVFSFQQDFCTQR